MQNSLENSDPESKAVFGQAGQEVRAQRGWLTSETAVQLKIYGERGLNIWKKKHKNKDFYIKITPIKASLSSNLEDGFQASNFSDDSQSMDMNATRDKYQRWPIVEVAVS